MAWTDDGDLIGEGEIYDAEKVVKEFRASLLSTIDKIDGSSEHDKTMIKAHRLYVDAAIAMLRAAMNCQAAGVPPSACAVAAVSALENATPTNTQHLFSAFRIVFDPNRKVAAQGEKILFDVTPGGRA
jgi:hypothetical protein